MANDRLRLSIRAYRASDPLRRRVLAGLLAVPAMLLLVTAVALGDGHDRVLAFLLTFAIVKLLFALLLPGPAVLAWLAYRRSSARREMTFCEASGLRVHDIHFQLSEIALIWAPRPCTVEVLTYRGDELHFQTSTPEDASGLVRTVRRSVSDRGAFAVSLHAPSLVLYRKAFAWFIPMAAAALLVAALPAAWIALPLALAIGWMSSRGEAKLRFGADGFLLVRRGRRRFSGYGEILAVQPPGRPWIGHSVRLALRSSARLEFTLMSATRAALVRSLLSEGHAMHRAAASAGAELTEIARGHEALGAWFRRLDKVGRTASYRRPSVDDDRLSKLMSNPAAAPAHRLAAALALKSRPSGAARIRRAASVSSEPVLRRALSRVARQEPSQRELESALLDLPSPG